MALGGGNYGGSGSSAGEEEVRQSGSTPPSSGGSQTGGIDFGGGGEEESEESTAPQGSLQFYEEEYGNQMSWQDMVYSRLPKDIGNWAELIGEDPSWVLSWLEGQMPHILHYVDGVISPSNNPELHKAAGAYGNGFINSPQGMEYIYGLALDWVRAKDARFAKLKSGATASGRGGGGRGGGGGGRGPVGPTMKDFDLDEMADAINDLWFTTVLDDAPDARGLARAYAEAVIRDPLQKRDFQTYVKKKIEGTARYKTLMKRKPEGMDAAQFIQPLYQMALQTAGTDEATSLAAGAAQFGGDPNAFRSRLQRTDSVTSSAPFIQSLEERMGSLNSILKG